MPQLVFSVSRWSYSLFRTGLASGAGNQLATILLLDSDMEAESYKSLANIFINGYCLWVPNLRHLKGA